jgi:hypothetical protein
MPAKKIRLSVIERAQRYVAKLDVTACGSQSCHPKTYHVACVLVQGFALSLGEALPLLQDWASRGSHKWSESELRHKLQCALAENGFQSREGLMERGCFLKGAEKNRRRNLRNDMPMSPEAKAAEKAKRQAERDEREKVLAFDKDKLADAAGMWAGVVNLVWLANRSALDPAMVTAEGFLRSLYLPGEKVLVLDRYDDGHLWPDEPLPASGQDGVKLLANPVSGQYLPNPRGRPDPLTGNVPPSRRIVECVTAFRFLVLESDKADLKMWLGFLAQVPLPIVAVYTSGGRSIHTLVRLDCRSRAEYEAAKASMAPFLAGVRIFGVDPGPMQPLAPTRLPGCWREGKTVETIGVNGRKTFSFYPFKKGPKLQKLLYLNPRADARPLTELPAVRDVEAYWCGVAAQGISDADETGGAAVQAALGYYANTSKACLAALRELREVVA